MVEISGFSSWRSVGSWVQISGYVNRFLGLIFGFDFGWCMVIKKVLERQRKEKKIRINLLKI